MSAMKNVAITMEEILEILDDMPVNHRLYLIKELPEMEARRRARELGIDIPSRFTAVEWMGEAQLEDSKEDFCPVHQEKGKWYFWDEVWSDRLGPYATEQEARQALAEYCKEL